MNRQTKNIAMIAAAVVLAVMMIFTVNAAGNSSAIKAPPKGMQKQQMQMDQKDMNGPQGQQADQNNGQNGPPSGQPPQGDGQTNNNQSGQQADQNNGQSGPPQMFEGHKGHRAASIHPSWYIAFGVEALAFAMIILYLIMSRMNEKNMKEVFRRKNRIAIFALAVVLAAGCLTQVEAGVSKSIADKPMKSIEQSHDAGSKQSNQNGSPQGQAPGQGEQDSVEAKGATTVDGKEQTLNDDYTSTEADENAILVTGGGKLNSDGATIDKKSGDSSNTGSSDFSGVNAALLVNDDSTATIKNATIKTSAKGANGVFATGEKSTVKISDSTITTTGEASSRGLDATYGGTIEATNVKITTQGGSCAAMATDRGEGTVSATKSTLETNGAGSPVIYSTGKITLTDSTGKANGAQITVVEGKNSATIKNSSVTCSAAGNRGDVDVAGVMVYQSMSGDAGEGTGNFTATDSKLTIDKNSKYYKTAPMFFVTNTDAVIKLTNTELNFGSGMLLSAKGTSEWGNEGSNGGTVTMEVSKQKLNGNITLDKISSLTLNMSEGSTYTGTINGDNTAKSVKLTLDKTSKIKLTGDSYVTSLEDADSSYSNIDFNGHTLYVNGKAIEK